MKGSTKEKMVDAAIRLFYTQGYDGTSVRDIASSANVNIALVSYYFGGKKALYEKILIQFLEGYLQTMHQAIRQQANSVQDSLLTVIRELLLYQATNHYTARMVHREMTLDSVLVREIMTTYLRKEKHDYEQIIKLGMKTGEFQRQSVDYVIIQIRTMVNMPYLTPHYFQELYQLSPKEPYFVERYMEHITRWVKAALCRSKPETGIA
ncbi:forespore capture DNA-binding protein RefZ [Alkalihalobacillus oceani]|uniref:forespore capture DNA-binding protein RefZ n=1 Tax=Halalkalibacter oceani TaxID=1653776 RepID=UPI00203ABBEB|nr:forespore capture DNA-binding protein RefZ [Halalkalibacter oceani]MCM3759633.1 forespore capture DNA-binding protein RefZ [Halalkalibacter oceani]